MLRFGSLVMYIHKRNKVSCLTCEEDIPLEVEYYQLVGTRGKKKFSTKFCSLNCVFKHVVEREHKHKNKPRVYKERGTYTKKSTPERKRILNRRNYLIGQLISLPLGHERLPDIVKELEEISINHKINTDQDYRSSGRNSDEIRRKIFAIKEGNYGTPEVA